jgi:ketosteroid isomerase-like protein
MQMKKITLAIVSIILLATSFTACTNFGSSVLSETYKTAISKATTDINQAFNASNDYKATGNTGSTNDATVFCLNSEAIKGHDAIIASFSLFGSTLNVFPIIHDNNGINDLAYELGTFKIETNTGEELNHRKYFGIWNKQNNHKWQVIYNIYETSVPITGDTAISNN